jgi:hypothetical protein
MVCSLDATVLCKSWAWKGQDAMDVHTAPWFVNPMTTDGRGLARDLGVLPLRDQANGD